MLNVIIGLLNSPIAFFVGTFSVTLQREDTYSENYCRYGVHLHDSWSYCK